MTTATTLHPLPETAGTGPSIGLPAPGRLVDLILKDQPALDRLVRDPALQPALVTRLLGIALSGFVLFGVVAGIAATFGEPSRFIGAHLPSAAADVLPLTAAYAIGLVLAIGVCLPSFYFYGLLAGIRPTMLEMAVHALKVLAVTAVTLAGLLPVALVLCLGVAVLDLDAEARDLALGLVLVLPFLAGLCGVRSLYRAFASLAATPEGQAVRTCFLKRFVLAWAGVYAAVTPLMIFTLWNTFRS